MGFAFFGVRRLPPLWFPNVSAKKKRRQSAALQKKAKRV
jgi:hypothetical protein